MASIESRGYSEGCQPLAGKIYTNITKMVVTSWKQFLLTKSCNNPATLNIKIQLEFKFAKIISINFIE